jgi:ornithine decarboxylase
LRARHTFDIGHSLGFDFDVLDIGGGFPGDENAPVSFEEIANALHSSLQHHFPPSSGVHIISEPGRFFAAASHTLAVNVIGRKLAPNALSSQASSSPLLSPSFVCPSSSSSSSSISAITAQKAFQGKRQLHGGSHTEPHYMYFVNDGLYGSFNCLLYDHAVVHPIALSPEDGGYVTTTTTAAANMNDSKIMMTMTLDEQPREPPQRPKQPPTYMASIWGPTCDGLDCIAKDIQLPVLDIGQWIYFPNMGAYTSAAGSHFNGFAPPEKIYFDSKEEVASMES